MTRPKAITTGSLKFGPAEVDVYNLDDGRRVLSQRGAVRAITAGHGPGRDRGDLAAYLDRLPARFADISSAASIEFELPSGGVALGRDVEWFVDVCNAYVDAAMAGELHPKQLHLAAQARVITSACAKTGIAALVDEATGYQYVRQHGMLAEIFAKALRDEASAWKRTWKDDVVDALCRTFHIQRKGREFPAPLMGVVGKLYRTLLGRDVHDELRRRNPGGDERDIHTQWMSDDTLEFIRLRIEAIRAIALECRSKAEFWAKLERYAGLRPQVAATYWGDDESVQGHLFREGK